MNTGSGRVNERDCTFCLNWQKVVAGCHRNLRLFPLKLGNRLEDAPAFGVGTKSQ